MSDESAKILYFPREKRDPKWIERLCLELIEVAETAQVLPPDAINRIVQRIGALEDKLFKPIPYPCTIPAGLSPKQVDQFKQACAAAVSAASDKMFERVFRERVFHEISCELGKL